MPDSVSLSALTIQKHFRGFAARKALSIQNIKDETVFFFEEDYKIFKPEKKVEEHIKTEKCVSFDVFPRFKEFRGWDGGGGQRGPLPPAPPFPPPPPRL